MNRLTSVMRLAESFTNGLRYGFIFLRVRWFRMPRRVLAAGKRVPLHYPSEHGAQGDFFACFIRNDYGLRRQLPQVHTILDIGANAGFFSIAARGRYPRATIHAYEPNPRVLPYLEANAAQVGVTVFPEAVGSESGLVQILDSGESNQARTQANGAGEIPLVALDMAIERIGGSVDLLKLDCEGAEWDLFHAAGAWRQVRNLRMEYHLFHGETVAQVDEALRGLGFKPIHWEHDVGFGMVWATRSD
jgi:FkbM family methyltransferase